MLKAVEYAAEWGSGDEGWVLKNKKNEMVIYNTIIIGGGVSGLTTAYKLRLMGRRVVVLERGKDIFFRNRSLPYDVANGVGGAGLYSDGKLSLYPSATKLWQLDDKALRDAYSVFKGFIGDFSVDIGDFPEIQNKVEDIEGIKIKKYQSLQLSLEQRMGIIYRMAMTIGAESLLTEVECTRIRKTDSRYEIDINQKGQKSTLVTESIVMAGGKHCFPFMRDMMSGVVIKNTFKKTEIGLRIECNNVSFDYYSDEQKDVKLISHSDSGREMRTFCCCRDGVVLQSESYGFIGFNGSSGEQAATGKSNIGILVQTEGHDAIKLRDEIKKTGHLKGDTTSLTEFMQGNHILLGETVDEDIRLFVKEALPSLSSAEGTVFFPAIEKMGCYPCLTDTLQIENENIWVCGDATGLFRGLLPAFVSGFIVADCLARSLRHQEDKSLEKIHVKVSSTQPRKVVFAAQSKQTFYCRNAVCEYIFNHDCIPVNPFRIFGYFLDERVDRSRVRNGNNEMIARCDELWVFGQISDGVLFEIALCHRLGKPVRYFSISAIAKEIKELRPDELVFEPEVHKHQVKRDDLLKLVSMSKGEQDKEIQLSLF